MLILIHTRQLKKTAWQALVFPVENANLVYSAAFIFSVLHHSGHITKLLQSICFCLVLYHCVLIEQEGYVQRKKT